MTLLREEFPPNIKLVVDSSIFLRFAFVKKLPEFISWFPNKLIVTPYVLNEVLGVSKNKPNFGNLNLKDCVDKNLLELEKLSSEEETALFFGYSNQHYKQKIFGRGEASCLAVSLVKHYGIICDEKEIRDIFNEEREKRNFDAPAWNAWKVVDLAIHSGLISEKEGKEIKEGFPYG